MKSGNTVKIFSDKMPFEKTNRYNLPTLNVSYDDIPKILNKDK